MMKHMQIVQVAAGLYWVSIPEVDFYLQCGCMQDSVKYLIQRGCIEQTEQHGLIYETGPNAVLLADTTLQGGHFSNLAEFPVAHMYFHQGKGLVGHPNYSSRKPLLIGSSKQIAAQLQYIHRGKYGLTSKEELLATGMTKEDAAFHWNMKMEFASGEIKRIDQLLDAIVLSDQEIEIRDGIRIRRDAINLFTIRFREDSAQVDLSIPATGRYPAPYPLGFHDVPREYFAIVHSGQGDGWDINRPAMSSILVYQGKIYLIDAGPNVAYSLIALGIGVNEIAGVFTTHCHDDHFAGLSALMYRDTRVKYYATPFVRASVIKKFAALLSRPEEDFYDLFDVRDLKERSWNDLNGLEVRPVLSPHPVETTTFQFRTHYKGTEFTYTHLADIVSNKRLGSLSDKLFLTQDERIDAIRDQYFSSADIKKIDIGTSEIHGNADDFEHDNSDRLILAHTKTPLTSRQKEIGS
ncbi:MAG: MBL fold metallo-hydrolase, partial [Desulfobacterales bacterium]|nr:MBL fold metallo-hydrolase [Desulfobacterales bacterium]